jgi:hypothetical protein
MDLRGDAEADVRTTEVIELFKHHCRTAHRSLRRTHTRERRFVRAIQAVAQRRRRRHALVIARCIGLDMLSGIAGSAAISKC